jgi:hypothetical protein
MLNTDDFTIVVPIDGAPRLIQPGDDLSPLVNSDCNRLNKTVALKDGRSIKGSIFRARATTAADELGIMELLNAHFVP